MRGDREFRIRPGRIRSTRAQQARPFIAQALAAAKKAGGGVSRAASSRGAVRGVEGKLRSLSLVLKSATGKQF